jgi:hypothetical protein
MLWKSVVMVLVIGVSGVAPAQGVDPGLNWSGSSGTNAGPLCGGFTCTPIAVPVTIGETVTITLRGTLGTGWALGVSPTASQCLMIPGIHNSLILDFPIEVPLSGVFTDGDVVLSCPGGRASITFTFPVLPPWTNIALQAVAQRPDLSLSLTCAIRIWVL